jgi:hypothetical protein
MEKTHCFARTESGNYYIEYERPLWKIYRSGAPQFLVAAISHNTPTRLIGVQNELRKAMATGNIVVMSQLPFNEIGNIVGKRLVIQRDPRVTSESFLQATHTSVVREISFFK